VSWCPSCGGVVGRDCFNPEECAWISQQMAAQQALENARYAQAEKEYFDHIEREYGEHLERQYESHLSDDLGFDPISLGM